MTAKEIFLKIKAAFELPAAAPAVPAAPAAPAVPATPMAKTYKLQDGTEITINQAGEVPAVGDTVMIAGAPAPAGNYTLEGGATLTVDETGTITVYTAMAAAPPATPAAPAAPAIPAQPITQAQMAEIIAKFAIGSTDERLVNLETMCKALMEYSFGYKIQKEAEEEAVRAYKESVEGMITSMKAESQKTIDDQAAIIARHEDTIKGMFDLVEKLIELPTADPVTLTGTKKDKFDRQNEKEQRIQKMADAIKQMKEEAKG